MIGIFDSGIGGLSILRSIHKRLPEYRTVYFGDSANAPYGSKTPEEILDLTWRGVKLLFDEGAVLAILACNTATAQALCTIQKEKLKEYPGRNVLGIVLPTVEEMVDLNFESIAILATPSTVSSGAYIKEFNKLSPKMKIVQHAPKDWTGFVEANKVQQKEAQKSVKKHIDLILEEQPDTQAILLACTHFPALFHAYAGRVPVPIFAQGGIIAGKLRSYLERHPEFASNIEQKGDHLYLTSGDPDHVSIAAEVFMGYKPEFQKRVS
jgi:glutamate racemase